MMGPKFQHVIQPTPLSVQICMFLFRDPALCMHTKFEMSSFSESKIYIFTNLLFLITDTVCFVDKAISSSAAAAATVAVAADDAISSSRRYTARLHVS